MRGLTIDKTNYRKSLVKMLYDWNTIQIHPHAEFIDEMLNYAVNGMVLRPVIRPAIKAKLGLTENNFKQIMHILLKRGDFVKKVGHTYYLNPKYVAILECNELFVITIKDSGVGEEPNRQ